jgi:porin
MRRGVVAAAAVTLASGVTNARGDELDSESFIEAAQSAHRTLAEHGIDPALAYVAEGFADVAGGARRGELFLGNLNLQLTLDMRRLVGWHGATMYLSGLGIHGGQPSDFAGDAQGVSSIQASPTWTLEEAWVEQNLFGNHFSALVGRYDLNSEFDRAHTADLFLNASFGVGPEFSQSGRAGPSLFPDTSLGARVEVKPIASLVIRGAVLDGVPVERGATWNVFAKGDGLLLVGETAFLYRPPTEGQPRKRPRRLRLGRQAQLPPYDAKLAVGVWHYTATFPDLSETRDGTPVPHHGSTGAYAIGDAMVYRDAAAHRVRVFAQAGLGDPRVNRFGLYTGGGLSFAGAICGRENDQIGLAVAAARNGSHFVDQQRSVGQHVGRVETTLELTYLAPITSWLSIQPDLQYVINPNTDPGVPNALVGFIRIELALE